MSNKELKKIYDNYQKEFFMNHINDNTINDH